MFDNLKEDSSIEQEKDRIGGGTYLLDSGVYDMVIDMAYIDTSKGGATSVNMHFKGQNGENLRQQFWVTSGKAKGCKNYYLDKDGKKQYLPGFNQANSISKLATGKPLAELDHATKTIKVYDFAARKEQPVDKEVLTELLGQPITLGVIRQTVDKNVKNAAGDYVASGETRDENEIDKAFRTSDKLTNAEIQAGETTPVFYDKWKEKNTGETRNKAKGPAAIDAAIPAIGSGTPDTTPPKSLFGNESA